MAMGVGPLALYGLSANAPLVIDDLGLSIAQFGSLGTVAFLVAAVSSALLGRYVDRHTARSVMVVLYLGTGLAFVTAAAANSFWLLLIAVAVSGCAQSLSNPVTNRLITNRVPPGRRGLLMGVKQAGVQMAQFIAGLTLPAVALLVGWRGALGLCVVVAAAGLWLALRVPSTVAARTVGAVEHRTVSGLPRSVWWLMAYALLTGAGLYASNMYLPLFSYDDLGLSATVAGFTAAVVGGVGLVARIGFGHVADRMKRPHWALSILAAVAAVGAACLLASSITGRPSLMWLGAVVFGASGIATNVVVMLALVRVTPLQVIGAASGRVAIGLYSGFAVGPICFGLIVETAGSYQLGWLSVVTMYAAAALLALLWRSGHGDDRADADGSRGLVRGQDDREGGGRPVAGQRANREAG
jgi:predicted MFS family arabinose efflux permease